MNKTPKLRFEEFSGDWQVKKLGNLLEFKNGINASKEQYGYGKKFINVLDILNNNYITHENIVGKVDVDEATFEKYSVGYGDVVFQRSSETREEVGTANVYLDKDNKATFGGFIIRGKKIGEYDPIFMNKLLKSSTSRKEITTKSGGSTRYNVGQETLSEVRLLFPKLEEQEKIASFFSLIDDKISLQGEKVEALKDYKKGMMQKIFSRELRFKDDDGGDYPEWEDQKLGDFTNLMQSGLSRKLSDKDIGIPVIRSNNLIDGKIDVSDIKYWHRVDDQGAKLENYFLKNNDLLVNFINSLAQIGKCSIYTDKLQRDTIFTTNIMRLNFKDNVDVNYIFNYFQLKKYSNYIQSITKPAVNQASFTTVDFKRFKVNLPRTEEQIKIGKLFKFIDSKIEKEQEKLNSLKEYKNGLLQHMFI